MELDKDLQARQQARDMAKQAEIAQRKLAQMSQCQLDRIVSSIAAAFSRHAVELAELAVRETGFGNAEDKVTKNNFAAKTVYANIKNMRCVGVLKEDAGEKLWEIGVPVGPRNRYNWVSVDILETETTILKKDNFLQFIVSKSRSYYSYSHSVNESTR